MNSRLLALILALVIVPATQSAPAPKTGDDEAPYKSTKVGDFATYKMSTKVVGANIEGTMTQTVTAKSDKELTIKTSVKMMVNGMVVPSPEKDTTIDLTKPFDPFKASMLGDEVQAPSVEKLKEGKEKVKVAGKEYDAAWTTYKVKLNAGPGQAIDAEMKVWTSAKMTMNLLKMEMSADFGGMKMEMAMELTEVGSKDK